MSDLKETAEQIMKYPDSVQWSPRDIRFARAYLASEALAAAAKQVLELPFTDAAREGK